MLNDEGPSIIAGSKVVNHNENCHILGDENTLNMAHSMKVICKIIFKSLKVLLAACCALLY